MEAQTLGLLEDFARDQLTDLIRGILPYILIVFGVLLLLISLIPWWIRLMVAIVMIAIGVVMVIPQIS